MKSFHLSLMSAISILTAVLPPAGNSILQAQSPSLLFRRPADAATVFRGQSPDSGSVPLPVSPGMTSGTSSELIPNTSSTTQLPGSGSTTTLTPTPEFMTGEVYSSPMASGCSDCCGVQTPDLSAGVYPDVMTWSAFSPQYAPDPFVAQPGYGMQPSPYAPYNPYGAAPMGVQQPSLSTYGASGAQPYRFGWNNAVDVSWLPGGDVTGPAAGATGSMEIFGVDYELGYTSPFIPGWILNWGNQFSYRHWNGPQGGIGLPSDVYRFGVDLEMETPQAGPWSLSLAVTPSLNTDFDASASEGFQLDGRGIILMQLDPYWTLGLGAMYWDRVDDIIIPWAGLIYRDDYWEWQLMFPEARVSLFLGNEAYWSKWLYVRGEYHVEAYGISDTFGGVTADDQIQLSDYRILAGFNMDSGYYRWFIEGGWVLDRSVEFDNAAIPGYDLKDGFIGQIGLRY